MLIYGAPATGKSRFVEIARAKSTRQIIDTDELIVKYVYDDNALALENAPESVIWELWRLSHEVEKPYEGTFNGSKVVVNRKRIMDKITSEVSFLKKKGAIVVTNFHKLDPDVAFGSTKGRIKLIFSEIGKTTEHSWLNGNEDEVIMAKKRPRRAIELTKVGDGYITDYLLPSEPTDESFTDESLLAMFDKKAMPEVQQVEPAVEVMEAVKYDYNIATADCCSGLEIAVNHAISNDPELQPFGPVTRIGMTEIIQVLIRKR